MSGRDKLTRQKRSRSEMERSSSAVGGPTSKDEERPFKREDPFSTRESFHAGTKWSHHDDSDDSDAEGYVPKDLAPVDRGFHRVFRALSSKDDPFKEGIKGANPRARSRTVAEHVQGGGKSRFVSLTQNKRKAVKWALKGKSLNPPRVATIDIPKDKPVADLSDPITVKRAGLGSTGANFARSSSEVLVEGPIPKTWVKRVEVIEPKKSEAEGNTVMTRVHTGTSKTSAKPRRFMLTSQLGPRKK